MLGLLILVARFGLATDELHVNRSVEPGARTASVVDLVVHDACGKRVAFLGEAPMHGFGNTLELKAEIARRLVDECHYNAVFFESGAYDFLNIQRALRAGQPVTQPMIAAAIGGLWATREVEPLLPVLLEKVRTGALVLGGLDDQLGRATYAQQQMPNDLAAYLRGDDRARCVAILQRHTLWQYTAESPYSAKDKALILGCLGEIEHRLAPAASGSAREYHAAMIENLKRYFARDFREDTLSGADGDAQMFNERDHSMYLNFQWFMSRLPASSKVIVWTATNHAAKSLHGVPGQEKRVSLGSRVRREMGDSGFVLGVSALSGSYGMARQPERALSAGPANSLEALAMETGGADVAYLDSKRIRAAGSAPARLLGPDFKSANWDEVIDGLVVFRQEHPPQTSSPH